MRSRVFLVGEGRGKEEGREEEKEDPKLVNFLTPRANICSFSSLTVFTLTSWRFLTPRSVFYGALQLVSGDFIACFKHSPPHVSGRWV